MSTGNAAKGSNSAAKRENKVMQYVPPVFAVFCISSILTWNVFAQEGSGGVESIIATSTPIAIAFMISILVLKVTAFILGYLIVKLGHDTMIRGVTGDIDFGFSGSGFETKLKSASPGTFFILMGAAIIIWGLTVDKPFTVEVPQQQTTEAVKSLSDNGSGLHRPEVPE